MRILRKLWTGDKDSEEVRTASQYVLDLRNRVEETCKIARESLRHASAKQKAHFDKKAKPRSFQVGSQVLLLLPWKKNKLEWRGEDHTARKRE